MKWLLLLLLITPIIAIAAIVTERTVDECGRSYKEAMEDNKNNIVCATPNFNKKGPHKVIWLGKYSHYMVNIRITQEDFLNTYNRRGILWTLTIIGLLNLNKTLLSLL